MKQKVCDGRIAQGCARMAALGLIDGIDSEKS
jgi:hypothetical protein